MSWSEEKGQTRAELTLDSNHQLPATQGLSFPLDQKDVELAELRRLCATASGDQKVHLEAEIAKLEQGGPGSPKHGKKGVRPWSARPVSRSTQLMKTIPESRQHVRPLSSKMRGVSGISSLLNGEADLQALHKARPRHSRGDLSSCASDASTESDASFLFSDDRTADEVTAHDIHKLYATCFDQRHPPRHCVDRNPETFFSACGLYPQVFSLKFRRAVVLRRVSAFCAGVKSLRLKWHTQEKWCAQVQTMSRGAPAWSTTEFVFDTLRESGKATGEVLVEIVAAHADFCRVRHLGFVEASSQNSARRSRPSLEDDGSPLGSPARGPRSPQRLCNLSP
jgi:hypothetical protein